MEAPNVSRTRHPSRGGFYHSHAHTSGRCRGIRSLLVSVPRLEVVSTTVTLIPVVGVSGLRWSQFPVSRWFLPQSRSYRGSARCRGIRSPLLSVPRLEVVSTTVTLIPVVGPVSGYQVSVPRLEVVSTTVMLIPGVGPVSGYQVSAGLSSPSRGGFYHSHAHTGGRPGVGVSGLCWSQFPVSRWFLPQSRSYRGSARCRGIRSLLVSVPRLEVVSTTVTLIPVVGRYQVSAGLSSPG